MNIFYKVTVEKKNFTLDYNGMVEENIFPRNYTKRIILLQTFGIERNFNFLNAATQSILKEVLKRGPVLKTLRYNECYYNNFKDETYDKSTLYNSKGF